MDLVTAEHPCLRLLLSCVPLLSDDFVQALRHTHGRGETGKTRSWSVQLTSPTYLKGMDVRRKNSCADVCILPSPCLSWEWGELWAAELAGHSIAGSKSVSVWSCFFCSAESSSALHGKYSAAFQGQQYSSFKQFYLKLKRQRGLSRFSSTYTLWWPVQICVRSKRNSNWSILIWLSSFHSHRNPKHFKALEMVILCGSIFPKWTVVLKSEATAVWPVLLQSLKNNKKASRQQSCVASHNNWRYL